MNEIAYMSAQDLGRAYRTKELSPREVVAAVLDRIESVEPQVNAFVTVTAEAARAQAIDAEKMFAAGDDLPPLFGVPVSVKDLEDTAGVVTTYGSSAFQDHVPDRDAIIWGRLKAAGCILIGKTTTPEFGASGVTESELTGITRNPWNLERTAGGSSGGAAVAVASGFGPIATGSDGGGSIRVPAASCGVVGLKPSVGRIPFNMPEMAFDTVTVTGPITRTVRDAALVLNATHGPDPYDPVSLLESGRDFTRGLESASLKGARIAYSGDLGSGPISAEVSNVVGRYVEGIQRDLGAVVEQYTISLPDPMGYFYDYWAPIMAMEAGEMAMGGEDDERPAILDIVVEKARRMSAVGFARTQMVERSAIHRAFADVFARYDLLVWPTIPTTAFPHPGEHGYPEEINGIRLRHPEADNQRLTDAISHAGYPVISIPCGFDSHGLPVGLQIAAGHGRDLDVLLAAAALEHARPWDRRPPLG